MTSPTADAAAGLAQPVRGRATLERERERFLAAVIDSADDAILTKDLDGTITSWNAGAERMYGYSRAEIVGRSVHDLAPPDRHREIDGILARLAGGGRVEHFETERVRKNGERFPVSLAISPVHDAGGTIVGASTVARDISEQRRLLESVQFQQSLLEAESEASIDGILVVDPDGRILFRNRRLAELWGLDEALLEPGRERELLDAIVDRVADRADLATAFGGRFPNPAARVRDEIRLRDGRVFDRYSAPVVGGSRVYGRVWYFRDITAETVRMAQLRAVIAVISDAAIVFDPNGSVLLRNPAADRLLPDVDDYAGLAARLGIETVDAPGQGSGTEVALDLALHPLEPLEPLEQTERTLVVDGAPLHLRMTRYRIGLDGSGGRSRSVGWLVLLRNVTELRDAQASREAFIGVLSHELRTPITTVYAAAKMLQRRQLRDVRVDLLRDIEAESDRLYRLVEDLLVLTRIERESLEVLDQPVRIGPIVRRVEAAERSRSPHLRLVVELGEGLPMARGEETYIEQIIRNLLGNAIKYGAAEGLVTVSVAAEDGGVTVRVLDEGPGIAAGEVDRVFELLYRSPATAAQAAGSGIGLFVSRRLAEAMGGAIAARTRPEGGSEFVLHLEAYSDPDGG